MLKTNSRVLLSLVAASVLLAACGQSNSAPPTVNSVNNGSSSYSKLEFAVGTANVAGVEMLNVVSTMRQPNGKSADLVSSPILSLPFSLSGQPTGSAGGPDGYSTAFSTGPSQTELGGDSLTSTSQTTHPGAPVCPYAGASSCAPGEAPNVTTFGESGGVFGMGLQPANNTTSGNAFSYVPYTLPIFGTGTAFVAWGGPPAFDDSNNGMGTRDGLHNLGAGLLGWNMGITIFQFTPMPSLSGTYSLSAVVPTGPSTTATETASATITNPDDMPTVTAPTFAADGNGGGTFSGVTLPGGATEGYIQIVDNGDGGTSCQGILGTETAPVYYTIEVVPGTTTYTLPDADGPNTTQTGPSSLTPSQSICTSAANTTAAGGASPGDSYTVMFYAMDYPLYEASYPKNTQQAPALVGSAGQDDITISAPVTGVSP